jgi:hypothetical protein
LGLAATATCPSWAWAAPGLELPELPELDPAERDELRGGSLVSRRMRVPAGDSYLIGGISYQRVRTAPEILLTTLQKPKNLPHLLPHTLSARKLEGSGSDALIELEQGRSPIVGSYTVRAVRRGERIRFWLDKGRAAPFEDLWGYFRVTPFSGRDSLLTVAVLLDLGPGMMRLFFEEKIQRIALATPRKIRDYVEPKALASRD